MSKHTPGPWRTGKGNLMLDCVFGPGVEENYGDLICDCGGGEADAAYIVRAVNAYETLLRLLGIALQDFNLQETIPVALLDELEAIAKAEVK